MNSLEAVESVPGSSEEERRMYLFALWSLGEPRRAAHFIAGRTEHGLGPQGAGRGVMLRRVRHEALADAIDSRHEDVLEHVSRTLRLHALPRSSRRAANWFLSMLAQQSRAVRDVVWMTCVMDLPKDDVAIALKLGVARLETLFDAAMACLRSASARRRDAQGRSLERSIATLRLLACRFIGAARSADVEFEADVPLLFQFGWFLVPVILIMGASEAAIIWGLGLMIRDR